MEKKRKEEAAIFAIFAAIAVAASGASPFPEVTRERFPDADMVLVDSFDDVAYNPDGTYVSTNTQTIKILTEKGRREESSIEMRYSARYGKAGVVEVKVLGEDGSVRTVDVAATTKEMTDNSSESENIYDPMMKRVVCAIPGVKVGDTLVYKTRRENFASRIKDQWADLFVLEWTCPILKSVVKIKSPAGRPLKSMALRNPLGNVAYKETPLADGGVERVWTMLDSPQMFPEPDMPPTHTQVQNLRVSTASDWKEISRWYWEVSLPHLEKTNAAITNKVEEIRAAAHAAAAREGREATREELLGAIYKWVAQEIRYMGLTMEDSSPGYAPHDVDITFENRYGVCRDKAALLVAMLRIAGFEAFPVLIHAGAKMDPDVPMPYFNHAIAAVSAEGLANAQGAEKYILMDPTNESSRDLLPAYLSDRSYLVARADGETLLTSPTPPAAGNAVKISSEATLDAAGVMLLQSRLSMSGINDNIYRQVLLRRKPEARRKLFERQLSLLASGAELLDLEITPENLQDTAKPLEIRLSARLPEALVKGETRSELLAPLLSRVFGAANWLLDGKTSLDTRKYPLVVDSTAMVEEELRVKSGDTLGKALSLPPDIAIAGPYSYERACSAGEGELTMRRRLAVNAVEFSPEAYRETRERIKEVEAAERRRAVFAKNRFAGANARVYLDKEEVWVASPFDWVVTNTVREQVLTYDGKKKLAELKFSYNPTWKNVELVSAVVSNRSGKVSRISPHEINVFDCTWAAAAPRYPASKSLIVNLPGVEVGSVIEYVVATTITNAPAAFYGKWDFDALEPTDKITLVLNGEEKTVEYPHVVPSEPLTADGDLWRDRLVVSSNDFSVAARSLRVAAGVEGYEWRGEGAAPWGATARSIRDWMAKNVRLAGPSLYEAPLAAQLTPVETILKERYACRLDYIRTMCALMKGAGLDADIVFASLDAGEASALRRRDMYEKPNVRAFSQPLCRVRQRICGFLWWGEDRVFYYGTENEYSQPGTSGYEGSHFFDAFEESFGVVEPAGPELASSSESHSTIYVRENGAIDIDCERIVRGGGVAAFRKEYAEMLPEERSRHYQELLGGISQGATATQPLQTDTEGYPATLRFSAFVPDYAIVAGDMLTISLPAFYEQLFPIVGANRANPVGIDAANDAVTTVRVVFPEGYTQFEHVPEGYEFADPVAGDKWYSHTVETSREEIAGPDGKKTQRLVAEIRRVRHKSPYAFLPRGYSALLRDWSRIGSERSGRTISVRVH